MRLIEGLSVAREDWALSNPRNLDIVPGMITQLDFTVSSEVVSTDFIGNRHAGIIDSHATIVQGSQVILYVWYDNEFGYSCQVIRVGQKMAGIKYPIIPAQPVTGESVDKEVASLKVAQ